MSQSFHDLGVPHVLVRALEGLGFTEPFPVQTAAIPPGLAGRDILGSAPTGSGKTLAFGLPMVVKIDAAGRNRPTGLVLAPTRELAEQIRRDLDPLAVAAGRRVCAVYGGVGYGGQLSALRRGADVLVATPGRLQDLIDRGSVDLGDVGFVVVDEADRMADMGFLPAVRKILRRTADQRQTLLFSATLDGEVGLLSRDFQIEPLRVAADPGGSEEIDAVHHFWRVPRSERIARTAELVNASGRSIVFTRTRHGADRLAKQLNRADVSAVALHGGRSQSQRTRALKAFSTGQAQALVATDLAARGIHVEDVAAVVHYDVAADQKDYVHRSGRTARAGATGIVITLVADGQDSEVRKLQRDLRLRSPIEEPRMEALKRVEPATGTKPDSSDSDVDGGERRRRGSGPRPSRAGRSIFVGNLPWKTTGDELEALFAAFGTVERATISTRAKSGRSKGFGFVDIVEHRPDAAIDALHGVVVDGRRLQVRPAR